MDANLCSKGKSCGGLCSTNLVINSDHRSEYITLKVETSIDSIEGVLIHLAKLIPHRTHPPRTTQAFTLNFLGHK
jgi:hypothetical protein